MKDEVLTMKKRQNNTTLYEMETLKPESTEETLIMTACCLYSGGWRSYDMADLMEKLNLSTYELEMIRKTLEALEDEETQRLYEQHLDFLQKQKEQEETDSDMDVLNEGGWL